MELQTQLAKKAESDDKNSLFSSDSEDENEEQSNKNNQALIPYVHQKVASAKSASKGTTKRCKKK